MPLSAVTWPRPLLAVFNTKMLPILVRAHFTLHHSRRNQMLNGFPQWTVLWGRQLPFGDALAGFQLDLLSLTSMEPLLCHIHGTLTILFMSSSLLHPFVPFLVETKKVGAVPSSPSVQAGSFNHCTVQRKNVIKRLASYSCWESVS